MPIQRLFVPAELQPLAGQFADPEQAAWINSQKTERGFATASDVERDMIREKQEERWHRLEKGFEEMSKRDGVFGPGPAEEIVANCGE